MGVESGAAPRNGAGVAAREGAVVNGPGGRLAATGQLTAKQTRFVQYAARGYPQTEAARKAGYAYPAETASKLTDLPHIRAALFDERERLLGCDLANLALESMRELITDKESTPASVRFQAARYVLETAGHRAKTSALGLPGADQPLEELSLDALQRFIAAGEAALASLKVIDGQAVRLDSAQGGAQLDDTDAL